MDRNWIIFFKNKLILILLVEHQPMNLQSTYFLNHIYIRSLVMSITLPDLSGLYRMCKPPRVYVCMCLCVWTSVWMYVSPLFITTLSRFIKSIHNVCISCRAPLQLFTLLASYRREWWLERVKLYLFLLSYSLFYFTL